MFIRHYLFIFALAIITCDALECLECDDYDPTKAKCDNPTLIKNKNCKSCYAEHFLNNKSSYEMGCSTEDYTLCRKYSSVDYKCHCQEDGCNANIRKYILMDKYVKIQGDSLVCFECDDNDPTKANCNNPTIITHYECKSCYAEEVQGHGPPHEMGCSTQDHKFCTQYTAEDYKCYCQENGCNANVANYFWDANYKFVLDISNCNRGYTGETCSECRDGYRKDGDFCCKYGFFNNGGACEYCNCSAEGMLIPFCKLDGKCYCRPSYDGDKCDKYVERVIDVGTLQKGAYYQVAFHCFGPCVWDLLEVWVEDGGQIDIEGVDQDFKVNENGIVGSKKVICSGTKTKNNREYCLKLADPGDEVYFLITAVKFSTGVQFRYKSTNAKIVGHKDMYAYA